jgi:hypothetical protein
MTKPIPNPAIKAPVLKEIKLFNLLPHTAKALALRVADYRPQNRLLKRLSDETGLTEGQALDALIAEIEAIKSTRFNPNPKALTNKQT